MTREKGVNLGKIPKFTPFSIFSNPVRAQCRRAPTAPGFLYLLDDNCYYISVITARNRTSPLATRSYTRLISFNE